MIAFNFCIILSFFQHYAFSQPKSTIPIGFAKLIIHSAYLVMNLDGVVPSNFLKALTNEVLLLKPASYAICKSVKSGLSLISLFASCTLYWLIRSKKVVLICWFKTWDNLWDDVPTLIARSFSLNSWLRKTWWVQSSSLMAFLYLFTSCGDKLLFSYLELI